MINLFVREGLGKGGFQDYGTKTPPLLHLGLARETFWYYFKITIFGPNSSD